MKGLVSMADLKGTVHICRVEAHTGSLLIIVYMCMCMQGG